MKIYRIVTNDDKARTVGSNVNRSGLYDTEGWVKNALRGFRGRYTWAKNAKIQVAEVEWKDL